MKGYHNKNIKIISWHTDIIKIFYFYIKIPGRGIHAQIQRTPKR